MRCTHCGFEGQGRFSSCVNCGASLGDAAPHVRLSDIRKCPLCGRLNAAHAGQCDACGYRFCREVDFTFYGETTVQGLRQP